MCPRAACRRAGAMCADQIEVSLSLTGFARGAVLTGQHCHRRMLIARELARMPSRTFPWVPNWEPYLTGLVSRMQWICWIRRGLQGTNLNSGSAAGCVEIHCNCFRRNLSRLFGALSGSGSETLLSGGVRTIDKNAAFKAALISNQLATKTSIEGLNWFGYGNRNSLY